MIVYRMKHKPTGLYYTPSKGSGNLSERGKLYPGRRPSIEWGSTVRIIVHGQGRTRKQRLLIEYFNLTPSHNSNGQDYYWIDSYFKVNESDWEIEEM